MNHNRASYRAGRVSGSLFQPQLAQPRPKMVRKPNPDCPSPDICIVKCEPQSKLNSVPISVATANELVFLDKVPLQGPSFLSAWLEPPAPLPLSNVLVAGMWKPDLLC